MSWLRDAQLSFFMRLKYLEQSNGTISATAKMAEFRLGLIQ